MCSLKDIMTWAHDNEIVLTLTASAIVGTMPETLPSLSALPQWMWTWLHDAAKTLLNFRRGGVTPNLSVPANEDEPEKKEKVKNDPSKPLQLNG